MTEQTKPIKVVHFVTGGFSGGATQVAIGLVRAQMANPELEPLLILRKKGHADQARVQQLIDEGLPVLQVNNWTHLTTIWELSRELKRFKPDILLAHGFSEHIWGRYAGLLAKVPIMLHIEHNTRERYTWWRTLQSKWLTKYTARIVGVSDGVRQVMVERGFPSDKCIAIPNGIHLGPFEQLELTPWAERKPGVVMVSRFAKQKDHETLVRAIANLRDRGIELPVYFAGSGKAKAINPIKKLVRELKIEHLVHFLGYHKNVPALLAEHQILVQSSNWEACGLSVLEGMAAGCAVVATDIIGMRENIEHGETGLLVAPKSVTTLADALQYYLDHPERAAEMAQAAREQAFTAHSKEAMNDAYAELFKTLMAEHSAEKNG